MTFSTTGSTRALDRSKRETQREMEQASAHSRLQDTGMSEWEVADGGSVVPVLEEAFLWPSAQGRGGGLTSSSGLTGFLVSKRQVDAASGKFLGLLGNFRGQQYILSWEKVSLQFLPEP